MMFKNRYTMEIRGRHFSILSLIGSSAIMLGLIIVGLTYFSDGVRGNFLTGSGYINTGAVLKIDNRTGTDLEDPTLLTNGTNVNCDNLACNGQYQGEVDTVIKLNSIHDFSYTLTNQGTVDYVNYTGDKIVSWVDGYEIVEYLAFDGMSYINTGVDQASGVGVKADFQFDNLSAAQQYQVLFGSQVNDGVDGLLFNSDTSSAAFQFQYGETTTAVSLGTKTTDRRQLQFENNQVTLWDETTSIATNTLVNDAPTTAQNIYVGGLNSGGDFAAGRGYLGKVFSFAMTDGGGTAIRNFVPVRDIYSGECGLYDQVTEQFFGNMGEGSLACPSGSDLQVLLFTSDVADSVIESELADLQNGITTTAPSAIANLDGSSCSDLFFGTEPATDVCATGVLGDTLDLEYLVEQSYDYNYKFVVYAPSGNASYYDVVINFGVSTGAQGATAINWKSQLRPIVSVNTPNGNEPRIYDAGMNKEPFLDQLSANPADIDDYLLALVTADDAEDGDLTDKVVITSYGGFDPSTVGDYDISYEVEDSDGNLATKTIMVKVWNFIKIDNGHYHGVALGGNGSVWTWGWNAYGQRGLGHINSAIDYREPTRIPQSYFGDLPVVDVAANLTASFAVNSDGKGYGWGYNGYGVLGDGTITQRVRPTAINMPDGIGFTQISTNTSYAVAALGTDGNVYTWGQNDLGQLGRGNALQDCSAAAIANHTATCVPQVITSSGDFVQVSEGYYNGAAVNAAGALYVWGSNTYGNIGNGVTGVSNNRVPTLNTTLSSGVAAVEVGYYHVVAMTTGGQVYCWGWNALGQCGQGNVTAALNTPHLVSGLSSVRQINAGWYLSQFVAGNDIISTGRAPAYSVTFSGHANLITTPYRSTMANIADNVFMAAGDYDNAYILDKAGKIVYGIGWCSSVGQEFGNSTICGAATLPQVNPIAWSFIPEALP